MGYCKENSNIIKEVITKNKNNKRIRILLPKETNDKIKAFFMISTYVKSKTADIV